MRIKKKILTGMDPAEPRSPNREFTPSSPINKDGGKDDNFISKRKRRWGGPVPPH